MHADLTAADAELTAATAAEQTLTRRLDAHDAGFSAASGTLATAQRERREVDAELAAIGQQVADVDERLASERTRIAELDATLPALEAAEQAEAAAARARTAARAALDAEARELADRRRALEVRSAGLHEREQLLERRLADTERRLEADVAARAEAHERRQALERSVVAVDRLGALVEAHRAVIERRHAELQELRRRQSDEVRAIAGRLDEARRSRVETERQLEELRERSRRVELDEAEVRLRLEGAVEALRRDHDLEPEVAIAAPLPDAARGRQPGRPGCATWSASCACSGRSTRSPWRSSPSCRSGTRSSRRSWRTSAPPAATCCG